MEIRKTKLLKFMNYELKIKNLGMSFWSKDSEAGRRDRIYRFKDRSYHFIRDLKLTDRDSFQDDKWRLLVALCLILLALVERLWLDLGPNIELITLITFIAGFYLGKKWAIIVPLITLAASDIFLGNTNIMLFTWSAYFVIGMGAWKLKSMINKLSFPRLPAQSGKWESLKVRFPIKSGMTVVGSVGGGAVAGLWFYLWTNFGVWVLDSWSMYERTLNGLITCYINGLPFLKNQLFGNLLIIPIGFAIIEAGFLFLKSRNYKFNLQYLK